jgi:hypothetical protein
MSHSQFWHPLPPPARPEAGSHPHTREYLTEESTGQAHQLDLVTKEGDWESRSQVLHKTIVALVSPARERPGFCLKLPDHHRSTQILLLLLSSGFTSGPSPVPTLKF